MSQHRSCLLAGLCNNTGMGSRGREEGKSIISTNIRTHTHTHTHTHTTPIPSTVTCIPSVLSKWKPRFLSFPINKENHALFSTQTPHYGAHHVGEHTARHMHIRDIQDTCWGWWIALPLASPHTQRARGLRALGLKQASCFASILKMW